MIEIAISAIYFCIFLAITVDTRPEKKILQG